VEPDGSKGSLDSLTRGGGNKEKKRGFFGKKKKKPVPIVPETFLPQKKIRVFGGGQETVVE